MELGRGGAERFALNQLHDDVGLFREVARATKRHMGPCSMGMTICSTSKPTMVAGS